MLPKEKTAEPRPVTLDLSAYGIDLIEYEGKVYMPLPTLNDIYTVTYNTAEYLNGSIYFAHSTDFGTGTSYYDRSSLYDIMDCTPAMASISSTR